MCITPKPISASTDMLEISFFFVHQMPLALRTVVKSFTKQFFITSGSLILPSVRNDVIIIAGNEGGAEKNS